MSPNLVEPLSKIIEAETNSVWNSWAVSVPVITAFPSTWSFSDGLLTPKPRFPELSIKTVAAVFDPPPLNSNSVEFDLSPINVLLPPK